MDFVIQHAYLIPLLPLAGAAVAGFFGARWLRQQSHWPIWIGVGASAVLAILLLTGMLNLAGRGEVHQHQATVGETHPAGADVGGAKAEVAAPAHGGWGIPVNLFTWTQAGDPAAKFDPNNPYAPDRQFHVEAGFWFDSLTAVMLTVVCGIGFFITVFAAGYMKGEEGYFRFFAYLGLFIFMMTILVMGNNLVMLYLGWEGVGLCSYLLIGYYYDRPAAREAAKKAFLVNRVGDFGFGLGIMLSFLAFGTITYFDGGQGLLELAHAGQIHGTLTDFQQRALNWLPFLLMLGAFGKSAQFPLYVWLPDAMEGPTPVSALIHAATMVTAGVYMIVRCGTLFVGNSAAMTTIAIVGAFTAIFAASIALRQFDLKKVFAYSTISQLGFMFVGVGALAPVAGVFHLITHAFFKALLFLSSGVVMHAMLGHLDLRKMSGLKRVLPVTNVLMLIGCAALAGFPFVTSGFYSKDEIVGAAFHKNFFLGLVMLVTAGVTAYYTFRLYFRVFQGPLVQPTEPAEGHHGHDDAHGGHEHTPEAHASHSAVATGTAHESGVDRAPAHGTSGGAPGHADDHGHGHHNHEPLVMILPLVVLAIGALGAGFINWPREGLTTFLSNSPSIALSWGVAHHFGVGEAANFGVHEPGAVHNRFPLIMFVSAGFALGGIALAYVLHLKDRAKAEGIAARHPAIVRILEAKYWVDEVYQAVVVEPLRRLGKVFFAIDRMVVDGIVTALSWVPQLFGWSLKLTIQRGSLQGYASAMLFGVVIILMTIFWPWR